MHMHLCVELVSNATDGVSITLAMGLLLLLLLYIKLLSCGCIRDTKIATILLSFSAGVATRLCVCPSVRPSICLSPRER